MSDSTQTSNIDLNFRLVCKYCKRDPPNIVEDYKAGDLVCGDCGLVFPMRIIDQRSEWRSFNDETSGGDPSRVGQAENPILEGVEDTLSTQIHFRDGRTGMSDTLRKTQHKVSGSVKGSRDLTESFRLIQHFTERISVLEICSCCHDISHCGYSCQGSCLTGPSSCTSAYSTKIMPKVNPTMA